MALITRKTFFYSLVFLWTLVSILFENNFEHWQQWKWIFFSISSLMRFQIFFIYKCLWTLITWKVSLQFSLIFIKQILPGQNFPIIVIHASIKWETANTEVVSICAVSDDWFLTTRIQFVLFLMIGFSPLGFLWLYWKTFWCSLSLVLPPWNHRHIMPIKDLIVDE